ncbi:hypothetical protein Taro_055356 [Colocasia esculenta]|uniref:Pentatricopeptide repeat-containing protein n=1 Tax=Colocasia esculenta TaxID=4460 RepID=A0A843XSP3_COLES|nr:hypothetical protein [Colocasia esculenta]
MIHAKSRRRAISPLPSLLSHAWFLRSNARWISSTGDGEKDLVALLREGRGSYNHRSLGFSLVSALKAFVSSLAYGEQIHALAFKSGLYNSNIFVRNGLINLYAKCGFANAAEFIFQSGCWLDTASWNIMIAMYVKMGRLDDAWRLFNEMTDRDCVSFTTMIMGLTQNEQPRKALHVFWEMVAEDVTLNDVTLSSVISACSDLHASLTGRTLHGLAIKNGLEDFVFVLTNLVDMYAQCSSIEEAETVFVGMQERNTVTWNAMLNGYTKAGHTNSARDLFEAIPVKDLVSWATMIDGYLRVDQLQEALLTYRQMLKIANARPNEVLFVNLVSSCARLCAFDEGQQFHGIILKTGLDCYTFMQATLIHLYAKCQHIDLACLQFQYGDKDNVSSWNALINGFLHNSMVKSAMQLFYEMPARDVVSWSTMITGYSKTGEPRLALDLFHEMQIEGVQPNEITMLSVLSVVSISGTLEHGRWIHKYIQDKLIQVNDNLSAGLIDMYSKCGSIGEALLVFNQIKGTATTISPWNAIICSLAMHGHADTSLSLFSKLQKTKIKPNSITFIGILTACCHKGLVTEGKHYFEHMKCVYKIEPNIKHYGCMVDLLGRAGCLEEAQQLIESMPMKADIIIWGSMLAASRTHGNVDIGEKAAEELANLEPNHGAGKVLLSNIYADAGRWEDALLVRRAMQTRKLKKLPACSGIMNQVGIKLETRTAAREINFLQQASAFVYFSAMIQAIRNYTDQLLQTTELCDKRMGDEVAELSIW